ncbi:hypothetical protein EAH87_00035 [Sphingomonas koreensis]|nr:hypothetical protein EAH87_00035 [Sphingomonas koreensis]
MTAQSQRAEELPRLRAALAQRLASADDAAFLVMLWALNAMKTARADEAGRFLGPYPPDAASDGIHGPHAIYPWELEALANELLVTEKSLYRVFPCRDWNAICDLLNQLRAVENAEYGDRRDQSSIFVELGRIAARQFPWQRGHFGVPQLYRNAFVYGQGECSAYLKDSAGLTASDMTLVGFSLLSVFYPNPVIRPAEDLVPIHTYFGIGADVLRATLDRIAQPIAEVRRHAREIRVGNDRLAYKPSVLRRFPCLRVGHRNQLLTAPLPDLIMDRVTNGLFYDVIGGGGPVRDEIGRRFEAYALDLLRRMMPEAIFDPEIKYRTNLGPVFTPDLLMRGADGTVRLAIECKASRMGLGAKFGSAPEDDRGYEEIAKGVMQLWRFNAHCRRQIAPFRTSIDAEGMILTMDEWFAGRSTVIPHILERAHRMADDSAHRIEDGDRRPVAFCTISELESVLATATPASLLETVRIGSGDRAGWIFSLLHDEAKAEKSEPKPYPFANDLGQLLPWYERVAEMREDADEQRATNLSPT